MRACLLVRSLAVFLRPQRHPHQLTSLQRHILSRLPRLPLLTSHPLTHTRSYTTEHPVSGRCWKCDRDFSEVVRESETGVMFFCPCDRRVVLPPSNNLTHFQIMDCPTTYRVNVEALKDRFRQLQRRLHPDQFSNSSPEEQEFSAAQSALVNKAYSTLLRPYTRGLYMLELQGLTIDETDNLTDSPEFLEEMWSVRETIDEAAASGDTTTLLQIQSTNSANLENISDEVAASFDSGDYVSAKEGLAMMKYFVNVEELLKDRLDLPP